MEIEEIIENARKEAPNPLILELVEAFEGFTGVLKDLQDAKRDDPDGRQIFVEKMARSYDHLKSKYIQVAASFGMGLEQFQEFLTNPKNFTPKSWAEMQKAKSDVAKILDVPVQEKRRKKIKDLKNRA